MKNHSTVSKLILLLFFCLLLVTGCMQESQQEPLLSVHILDVEQGDSTLIITPDQQTILIDGGESQAAPYIIGYLKDNNISKIDYMVATHPHSDHIGGLAEVIDAFEIGELIMPEIIHNTKTFESLLLAADAKGLSITAAKNDLSYQLNEDLLLSILGPIKDYGDNLNNWSAVTRLQYKKKAFLFMGDAEAPVEEDLLAHYDPSALASHFLKLGHHGSDSSTTKPFLDAVNPEITAISSGKGNPYGHPHREVVERIKDTAMYRTDQQGTVVLYSDGIEIWSHEKPIGSE